MRANKSLELGMRSEDGFAKLAKRQCWMWRLVLATVLASGAVSLLVRVDAEAADSGKSPQVKAPAATASEATTKTVIETVKPIPLDAINAVENNEWKTAVKALQEYLKSEPGSAEGHYLLGKSLFNLKRFAEAKEELRKALRLGKGDNFSGKANDMLMQMPKSMVAPKQHATLATGQAKIKGHKVAAAGIARPRILSFAAKWADPCKQLQVDLDKAKAEFGEQVEIYTVDVDDPKNEELMNQYEVSPIPTVVFLDAQGKVVSFLIGYSDPTELERSIKKVLNKS